MRNFEDLQVWQKARILAGDIYRATEKFPRAEQFGLTSQMRRAATSIMSNVGEGCGRRSNGEFARFLRIAMGSASELRVQLILATDLRFLEQSTSHTLLESASEVGRMLNGLLEAVEDQLLQEQKQDPRRAASGSAKG